MQPVDFAIVIAFLAGLLLLGVLMYRWVGQPDDFYVAGRRLPPFILAATLAAANENLYGFVGQAGSCYKYGLSVIWHSWTGCMALVFSGLFVLPVFRRLRIRTIPEFLGLRYSPGIRVLVGILWIFRIAFWLGIILYTSVVIARVITGVESFAFWLLLFSLIAVFYTMMGGMWSVVLTDVFQLLLMVGGSLIILPLAMNAVGWWPNLVAALPASHLDLVPKTGPFNWVFILSITLLGIQWACLDQGLLQIGLGARDVRAASKGIILSGLISAPFALIYFLPGLAAAVLHPGLANPDDAVPMVLRSVLPPVVMGLVMTGLMASQMSTIGAYLNGAATLFTEDVYRSWFGRRAGPDTILKVVRAMIVVVGAAMILFAALVPLMGGAVQAYLTIVGIMDMPLFVVAVIYGLLWKRANWQGALGGYLCGAAAGIIGRVVGLTFNDSTFISALAALIACPAISLLFPADKNREWKRAGDAAAAEEEGGRPFRVIPASLPGRTGLAIFVLAFLTFVAGVISGGWDFPASSHLAVGGMIGCFAGGLLRLNYD